MFNLVCVCVCVCVWVGERFQPFFVVKLHNVQGHKCKNHTELMTLQKCRQNNNNNQSCCGMYTILYVYLQVLPTITILGYIITLRVLVCLSTNKSLLFSNSPDTIRVWNDEFRTVILKCICPGYYGNGPEHGINRHADSRNS